jgi:hypothetical protein
MQVDTMLIWDIEEIYITTSTLILVYFTSIQQPYWWRETDTNDPSQGTFLYRTNLGTTVNKGIETFLTSTRFLNVDEQVGNVVDFFSIMSFIDSRYTILKLYNNGNTTKCCNNKF